MRRTSVFLEEELHRELQGLARRRSRPAAAIVREAIAEHVAKEKAGRPTRLGFLAIGASGQTDAAERHEDLLFADLRPHTGRRESARRSPPRRTRSRR